MKTIIALACIVFVVVAIWYASSTREQDRPQPFGGCEQAGGC